jgi:hypothetical protein
MPFVRVRCNIGPGIGGRAPWSGSRLDSADLVCFLAADASPSQILGILKCRPPHIGSRPGCKINLGVKAAQRRPRAEDSMVISGTRRTDKDKLKRQAKIATRNLARDRESTDGRRRKMSEAEKARISDAQKARWAKSRKK